MFDSQAWYTENLQISIPVSVVVGIVALIIIWGILTALRRFFTRRRLAAIGKESSTTIPPNAPAQRLPSWTPGPSGSGPMVPAGPFMVPEQRLHRNGSESSRGSAENRAENRAAGRRSIMQRGLATITNTWKGKMPNRSGPGGYGLVLIRCCIILIAFLVDKRLSQLHQVMLEVGQWIERTG